MLATLALVVAAYTLGAAALALIARTLDARGLDPRPVVNVTGISGGVAVLALAVACSPSTP